MQPPYTATVAISGVGNAVQAATPVFLNSSRSGVLELVTIELDSTSTPVTMAADFYVEQEISRRSLPDGDDAYSPTAVPSVKYQVDGVTGLTLVEDNAQTACQPDPMAQFSGGCALKVDPSGLGGADAWTCNVTVRVRYT